MLVVSPKCVFLGARRFRKGDCHADRKGSGHTRLATMSKSDRTKSFSGYRRVLPKICQKLFDLSCSIIRSHEEGSPRFRWTAECQQAFDTLKLKLMTEPILALPNDELTYILDTDASNFGLGAVLT